MKFLLDPTQHFQLQPSLKIMDLAIKSGVQTTVEYLLTKSSELMLDNSIYLSAVSSHNVKMLDYLRHALPSIAFMSSEEMFEEVIACDDLGMLLYLLDLSVNQPSSAFMIQIIEEFTDTYDACRSVYSAYEDMTLALSNVNQISADEFSQALAGAATTSLRIFFMLAIDAHLHPQTYALNDNLQLRLLRAMTDAETLPCSLIERDQIMALLNQFDDPHLQIILGLFKDSIVEEMPAKRTKLPMLSRDSVE